MHDYIFTDQAPSVVGPYSQAVKAKGQSMLFVSGQIPLDPKSMQVASPNVKEQTQTVLKNLAAILRASGATHEHVVKTTVYLKDMNDFAVMNAEYSIFFSEHKPARVCVEVARLPKDVLVEIDAIAVI